MKKFVSVLLICLTLAALLFSTGCHGSREKLSFSIPETLDESRNMEVVFWAKNDTNKTQVKIYENAIASFEKLYPNIHVKMRLYTDYGKIYNDVITNISTGTTPNVCITYPDHIATYLTGKDVVVPLDELFTNEKYGLGGKDLRYDSVTQAEIIPEFLNECFLEGHYYALPYMRSTEALYINKTYVEKLGYAVPDVPTWDFVWKVSEDAMKKGTDGKFLLNGKNVLIPFIYKSTDNMMITMLRQKNAGYSNENGEILLFNDTTKEIMKTVAEHSQTNAFSTFKISGYPANFLNAGQCIFAIDSTAGATWMGSDAPLVDIAKDQIVHFETAVRPVPQYDPSDIKMISQGPSVCLFNKEDPQEVLASWLFMQYLLTNSTQIAYSETEGYVPVTSKAQNDPEYNDYLSRKGEDNQTHYSVKIDAAQLLMNNTENTFTTAVFNGSTSLRDAAGQLIENTAKSVKRKQTADDAFLDKQFSDVTSLYRLDQIAVSSAKGKIQLGPLPATSVILLCSVGFVWILILLYVLVTAHKRKKEKSKL